MHCAKMLLDWWEKVSQGVEKTLKNAETCDKILSIWAKIKRHNLKNERVAS